MPVESAMSTRERILAAAAELLATGGTEAVSTRAVAAAAGVQAPTLYRLFGDKQGLLDAVTTHGFEQYLSQKRYLTPSDDPVEDLRRGWDSHVEFGLTHPAFYVLMYGVPRSEGRPAAAEEAHRILVGLLERIAAAGRLRLPASAAADMVHAACSGITLHLIPIAQGDRDLDLSSRTREAMLAAVTTDAEPAGAVEASLASRALALDAAIAERSHPLTAAEAALLREWLHRVASHPQERSHLSEGRAVGS
jgi:AcrR family transcriptional regulator